MSHSFASFDGARLAWAEVGTGRPLVLLHGLFSTAATNWTVYGTAASIAAAGFRVIMPDLRGHGASAHPHDPAAYPPDVLARDAAALVAHLGLTDFDFGGYSLGARTAVRAVVGGLRPARLVLGGMGLTGLTDVRRRTDWFLDVIARADTIVRGDPAWPAVAFMRANAVDGAAVAHVLRSQVATTAADLAAIAVPTCIVCGADDRDNGSAADLTAALATATYAEIPGNHMSAVTRPEFGAAIAAWLSA